MWKALIFTFLAVGAFAQVVDPVLSPERRELLKTALREQCAKHGAADKVDEVLNSGQVFISCIQGQIDFNTLKNEIEEAKPKGTLDEVFKKYCQKTPQLKLCFQNLLTTASQCMDEEVRSRIGEINTGLDKLFEFLCYKDGDRIALFIAEGGPECFQSKAEALRTCGTNLHATVPSMEAAKNLTTVQQCEKFDELNHCVVTALEECDTPTPGNMADSIFRYVRKESPCKTIDEKFF